MTFEPKTIEAGGYYWAVDMQGDPSKPRRPYIAEIRIGTDGPQMRYFVRSFPEKTKEGYGWMNIRGLDVYFGDKLPDLPAISPAEIMAKAKIVFHGKRTNQT